MKKPKDFKASMLLLGSVIVIIIVSMFLSSCSSYTCPTYTGVNKEKYKNIKSYTYSKPIFKSKKHL